MKDKKSQKEEPGKRKGALIIFILLLALSITSTGLLIKSLLPPKDTEATDLDVLENKIRQINELAVVNQIYRDVIYTKAGTVFTSETLFSIEYNITAGVDLSRGLSLQSLEGNQVLVTLPQPEIISIDADDTTIHQIYIRETFRNLRQSDYMELIIKEKAILEQAALDAGILNQARINTEVIIEKILKLSGYDEIRFRYISANDSNIEVDE